MKEIWKIKRRINKDVKFFTRIVVILSLLTIVEFLIIIAIAVSYINKGDTSMAIISFLLLPVILCVNFLVCDKVYNEIMERMFSIMREWKDTDIFEEIVEYIEKVWRL